MGFLDKQAHVQWDCPQKIREATQAIRARVVTVIESGTTISEQQKRTLNEIPVKGPTWVSKFTIPPSPEDDIRELLFRAIDQGNEGKVNYFRPKCQPLDAQWTGYRAGAGKDTQEPDMSEEEKYRALVNDTKSPFVILYVYGGAFYLNNPSSYRPIVSQLAMMTGGRCLTLRQRLAAQNPFPATLLDVMTAYMSLLCPPPGSFHQAIPSSSIVLAGDSSGACLCLGLLQVLLTAKREKWASSIYFHGKVVRLDLPAGLALLSPVGDLTNSLPSHSRNLQNDIFAAKSPDQEPGFPCCEIWPSSPPRATLYCEKDLLCNPIASPTTSLDWSGAPPMWFAYGQEQVLDAGRVIAQTAFHQGVSVNFQEYEAMPHAFPLWHRNSPQTRKFWIDWAAACRRLASGKGLTSKACIVEAKDLQEKPIDVGNMTPLTVHEAREMMKKAAMEMEIFTGQKCRGAML